MPKNHVFNLDEAVLEWAWKYYDENATRKQRRLRQKDNANKGKYLGVKIDWSDVRVMDETTWARLAEDDEDDAAGASAASGNQQQQHQSAAGSPHRSGGASASVLFQTRFENNTKEQQQYMMRTEKTTRSSMITEIEESFTRGFDMSVKLASPCQVFEANAGYKREFSLTKIEGESFEEELTWGVESSINVQPNHVAEATLVVDEKRQCGEFTVETRMSGTVYVTFTAPRDNNSQVKAVANDIANIVGDYVKLERRKGGPEAVKNVEVTQDNVVVIRTHGKCKFRYGVKQQIKVNQIPLSALRN